MNKLSLTQQVIIAALAGAAIGAVGVLVNYNLTKWVESRSVRKLPPKKTASK